MAQCGRRSHKVRRERLVRRSDVSGRATRATTDELLKLPRVRTLLTRRSFMSRAARVWIGVPNSIRGVVFTFQPLRHNYSFPVATEGHFPVSKLVHLFIQKALIVLYRAIKDPDPDAL